MVLRIETSGITRGREFSLYAFADATPEITAYAYNPVTREVVSLDCEHSKYGMLHKFDSVAPGFDGFLMAKVGKQKIVKRIGTPVQVALVIGYKEGYTAFYKAYDYLGGIMSEGAMENIVGPFFTCAIPSDAVMMEAAGKKLLINRNISRLNFEVSIDTGALNSSFEYSQLQNVTLSSDPLPQTPLEDATLDSTLPNVTIKEL